MMQSRPERKRASVPVSGNDADLGMGGMLDEIATIVVTTLADIRDEVRRLREELVGDDGEEEELG
jgi:hypothetical protein